MAYHFILSHPSLAKLSWWDGSDSFVFLCFHRSLSFPFLFNFLRNIFAVGCRAACRIEDRNPGERARSAPGTSEREHFFKRVRVPCTGWRGGTRAGPEGPSIHRQNGNNHILQVRFLAGLGTFPTNKQQQQPPYRNPTRQDKTSQSIIIILSYHGILFLFHMA
jgi:hypothetical protein